jgi:hypothetical protein
MCSCALPWTFEGLDRCNRTAVSDFISRFAGWCVGGPVDFKAPRGCDEDVHLQSLLLFE